MSQVPEGEPFEAFHAYTVAFRAPGPNHLVETITILSAESRVQPLL